MTIYILSLQSRVLFWCHINKSPIYFTLLTIYTRNIFCGVKGFTPILFIKCVLLSNK